MKKRSLYSILSFSIMLIIGMNLVISTLHSHHHLQWNHSGDFTDTGHCITTNTTLCPICGYVLKATNSPEPNVTNHFEKYDIVRNIQVRPVSQQSHSPFLGRAPPFSA